MWPWMRHSLSSLPSITTVLLSCCLPPSSPWAFSQHAVSCQHRVLIIMKSSRKRINPKTNMLRTVIPDLIVGVQFSEDHYFQILLVVAVVVVVLVVVVVAAVAQHWIKTCIWEEKEHWTWKKTFFFLNKWLKISFIPMNVIDRITRGPEMNKLWLFPWTLSRFSLSQVSAPRP